MSEPVIRMAVLKDAPAIQAIYEPYIRKTAITFEYEPIPVEAFEKRMTQVLSQFPWLVYEQDHKILGYAYCSQFKERAAFSWDCECSIYVDETAHHRGIATVLYTRLFELVEKQGYYNIYALITNGHESSIKLHRKFGFTEVGVYEKTGYKLGQWWDLLVMVKRLKEFGESPVKPHSINDILT